MKKTNEQPTGWKGNENNLFVNDLENQMGGIFVDEYYLPAHFRRQDTSITSRDQFKPVRTQGDLVVK